MSTISSISWESYTNLLRVRIGERQTLSHTWASAGRRDRLQQQHYDRDLDRLESRWDDGEIHGRDSFERVRRPGRRRLRSPVLYTRSVSSSDIDRSPERRGGYRRYRSYRERPRCTFYCIGCEERRLRLMWEIWSLET